MKLEWKKKAIPALFEDTAGVYTRDKNILCYELYRMYGGHGTVVDFCNRHLRDSSVDAAKKKLSPPVER